MFTWFVYTFTTSWQWDCGQPIVVDTAFRNDIGTKALHSEAAVVRLESKKGFLVEVVGGTRETVKAFLLLFWWCLSIILVMAGKVGRPSELAASMCLSNWRRRWVSLCQYTWTVDCTQLPIFLARKRCVTTFQASSPPKCRCLASYKRAASQYSVQPLT